MSRQAFARCHTGVAAQPGCAARAAAMARRAVSRLLRGSRPIGSPVAGLIAGIVSGSVSQRPPMWLAKVSMSSRCITSFLPPGATSAR